MKYIVIILYLIAHNFANGQPRQPILQQVHQSVSLFNPEKATTQLINTIPAAIRVKADNYCEGGHWLLFWNIVCAAFVAWLFLFSRLSPIIKKWAGKAVNKTWGSLIYILLYLAISYLLSLPLDIYQNFIREQQYGYATQNFDQWFFNDLIMFLFEFILAGPFFLLIYIIFRKVKEKWWLWGAGVSVIFIIGVIIIYPVFIGPLFNNYTPLKNGALKDQLLSMARANRVNINQVYVYNESEQTKQFNANVTGFAGTTRIALNDNILNRCTNNEIKAVIGHEMGHYVLNHLFILILEFGLLILLGFGLVKWTMDKLLLKYRERWKVKNVQDIGSLPLLIFLFTFYFFILTPVSNTIVRTIEIEADNYGLNAARQPDAFASVMLKSADYNKIDPGYWEEFIFFDHPCRKYRIESAMKWKAENLNNETIIK